MNASTERLGRVGNANTFHYHFIFQLLIVPAGHVSSSMCPTATCTLYQVQRSHGIEFQESRVSCMRPAYTARPYHPGGKHTVSLRLDSISHSENAVDKIDESDNWFSFSLEFEWIALSSFTSLWASGIGDNDLFHMFLFWLARLSAFPMEQHAVVCKDLFPAMGLCSFSRDCEQPDLEFSKSFICFCRAFLFICAPHVPASYDMHSLPA